MTVQLVGYALWYYEEVVDPRGGTIRTMVSRALLDLEGGTLQAAEVKLCDPAQAEILVSTSMSPVKTEEPALWRRLVGDLGAAANNGGPLKIVIVRFWKWMPPKRVTIRLASYRVGGEEIVFWMSIRRTRKR